MMIKWWVWSVRLILIFVHFDELFPRKNWQWIYSHLNALFLQIGWIFLWKLIWHLTKIWWQNRNKSVANQTYCNSSFLLQFIYFYNSLLKMVLVSNENVSISVCMKYWLWQQISWRCDLHIFIYLFLLNIAVTSSQNVTKRILIHNQTVHCNKVPAAIMLHFLFQSWIEK